MLALAVLSLAAFFGAIIFLPPEGHIGVPLHQGLAAVFGSATFMLPVALLFVGVLLVLRAVRPSTHIPRRRLAGIGLMTLAVLPSEHLLGNQSSTGLVGQWLSTTLRDLLGGPATLVVLVAVLGLGALLALDVRVLRVTPAKAEVPGTGQWKDAES